MQKNKLKKSIQSAITIQAATRMYQEKKKLQLINRAITKLQSKIRMLKIKNDNPILKLKNNKILEQKLAAERILEEFKNTTVKDIFHLAISHASAKILEKKEHNLMETNKKQLLEQIKKKFATRIIISSLISFDNKNKQKLQHDLFKNINKSIENDVNSDLEDDIYMIHTTMIREKKSMI